MVCQGMKSATLGAGGYPGAYSAAHYGKYGRVYFTPIRDQSWRSLSTALF